MNDAFFKTPVGIFKIVSSSLAAVVVGLSCYSCLNSHWLYHTKLTTEATKSNNLVVSQSSQNDYEDCVQNHREYSNALTSGGQAYTDSRHHNGILTCPRPTFELFLVSASIPSLILSLVSIIVFCQVKTITFLRSLMFYDAIFHGLSSVFFMVGGLLYIYSAYSISVWCNAKSKISAERYIIEDAFKSGKVEVHQNEISSNVQNPAAVFVQLAPGSEMGKVVTDNLIKTPDEIRIIANADLEAEVKMLHEEACNAEVLTDEKYWAAAMGILAAISFGSTLLLIFKSVKDATTVEFTNVRTSRAGRKSEEKAVGSGPSLHDMEPLF